MDKTPPNHPSSTPAHRLRAWNCTQLAALLALLLALSGCGIAQKALEKVGLKDPPLEELETQQDVTLRLFAGENLNAGNDQRPLSVVVKLYHLRNVQRFEQEPFETFLSDGAERAALGNDLLDVREIMLTPGTRHEIEESLPLDAKALGVVALFRAPAARRWRLAFDPRDENLRKQGVTVGLHACAITTNSPGLITRIAGDPGSLASVRCMDTLP